MRKDAWGVTENETFKANVQFSVMETIFTKSLLDVFLELE